MLLSTLTAPCADPRCDGVTHSVAFPCNVFLMYKLTGTEFHTWAWSLFVYQRMNFHINVKSSMAVLMWLEFLAKAHVNKHPSPSTERKACVYVLQGWVPCRYGFSHILVHSNFFSYFLALILGAFLSPGLLRVTRTLVVSPQRKVKSMDIFALWTRPIAAGDPAAVAAECTKDGARPRTLCSAYIQIPSNGDFFYSEVWIGWYFKKNSSWLNLEPEKKNPGLITHPRPFSWENWIGSSGCISGSPAPLPKLAWGGPGRLMRWASSSVSLVFQAASWLLMHFQRLTVQEILLFL